VRVSVITFNYWRVYGNSRATDQQEDNPSVNTYCIERRKGHRRRAQLRRVVPEGDRWCWKDLAAFNNYVKRLTN